MSQGDTDARFQHLLQPIRDLTKNWEVDIASQLEDYLTEIEEIRITFDGGSTSMNFAEAALLIQGSACIYSKKVEYLYALVYQTLDLLASKKKLQQPSSVDAEGRDKDASFAFQKNGDEFLLLDDIQAVKNIDLREVDINENLVKIVPQTPLSLVKSNGLEEDVPLTDANGEILGKLEDFGLMTSAVHASGTMLVDMSHMSLLDASLMHHPMSTPLPGLQQQGDRNGNLGGEGWPAGAGEPVGANVHGPDPPHDASLASLDDVDMAELPDDHDPDPIQPDQQQAEARREPRPVRLPPKPKLAPTSDPWATLDPHEGKTLPEKPFKKGKPFKMPAALLGANNKKRKRKTAPDQPPAKPLSPISQFISKAYYSHASKFPNSALKRPLLPEFDNLYYVEFRRQQAARRKEREALAKQGKFEELADREAEEAEDDPNIAPDDDDPQADLGPEIDDDDDGGNHGDGCGVFDDAFPASRSVSEFPSTQEIVSSYEDLVRKHVEEYMISAQKYTQVTELGKRVQAWEERITPILHREERFGFFDIHDYGTIVLDRLQELEQTSKKAAATTANKGPVPFGRLVEDRHPHDISRLFLATLQLANCYNVEIGCSGSDEAAMDTMALKLLSRKRHNEELQEYRAPSLDH